MRRFDAAEDPRRRVLIQALAAGVFTAGWSPSNVLAAPAKSIFRVIGSVTVNDLPPATDTFIGPNTKVRTARNSELIAILDKIAILLRADSELVVGDKVSDLRLIKGNLLAAAAPGAYRIETSIATIMQRGRDDKVGVGFYVESHEKLTYFCTCYGVSEISVNDDPATKLAVSAQHHDRPVNIYRDPTRKKRIEDARFKNHTDEELKLIGELIGHLPPFLSR